MRAEYDGDEEYLRLQEKIYNDIQLTEEDILKLIFLPLMKSKHSADEMALKAVELSKQISGDIKTFILGAIIAISDGFMSEDCRKKLLEVLKMTLIEQMIREEGMEEGKKEGKKEGKEEVAKKALMEGIDEDIIVKITGLNKESIRKLRNPK